MKLGGPETMKLLSISLKSVVSVGPLWRYVLSFALHTETAVNQISLPNKALCLS